MDWNLAEDVLTHVILSDTKTSDKVTRGTLCKRRIDQIIPMFPEDGDTEPWLMARPTTRDELSRLDICIADHPLHDEDDSPDRNSYTIRRQEIVPASKARKAFHTNLPSNLVYMRGDFMVVERGTGIIKIGGMFLFATHPDKIFWRVVDPDRWPGQPFFRVEEDGGTRLNNIANTVFVLNRSLCTRWVASIGYPGMASLRLPTTFPDLQDLLAEREKPEGRRRSALIHWVRSHTRAIRREDGSAKLVNVRSFLRGVQEAEWDGMKVKIEPPTHVIEDGKLLQRGLP